MQNALVQLLQYEEPWSELYSPLKINLEDNIQEIVGLTIKLNGWYVQHGPDRDRIIDESGKTPKIVIDV